MTAADRHDSTDVARHRRATGRGRRHVPRPAAGRTRTSGRAPTLPTVRQVHPALHTVEHPVDASGTTVARPPRRRALAPWSSHLPADGSAEATPAHSTTGAGGDPGRRRRVGRAVGWMPIGGVGLYVTAIALGIVAVLFFGRLSPPGLDRLTRSDRSADVATDEDSRPVDGTSKAYATAVAVDPDAPSTSTEPGEGRATTEPAGATDASSTVPDTAGGASVSPSTTQPREPSTTTTTPTTTESPSPGPAPPGSQGTPPPDPPGKP